MERVIEKWTNAIRNLDIIFQRAIVENQEEILDLNVAQLKTGRDSMGEFLMEYASPVYAAFKIAWGSKAPFGIPDLVLEGDFTEGFVLLPDGNAFNISSTDEKAGHLEAKYGSDIFGIAEDRFPEIGPDIAYSFIKHFRNELL